MTAGQVFPAVAAEALFLGLSDVTQIPSASVPQGLWAPLSLSPRGEQTEASYEKGVNRRKNMFLFR